MHGLDVGADVRRDLPQGTEYRDHIAGREAYPAPVVDVHPVRRRRG